MSENYAKRRINVRGIIVKENKLLAVKHRAEDGSSSQYYALPGGGLDPMESLHDGLKREIMEELGVEAMFGKLLAIQQFPSRRRGYAEELEFFFEITNVQDFENIDITITTHGAAELAVCEFIDPTKVLIYPLFLSEQPISELKTNSPRILNNLLERQ